MSLFVWPAVATLAVGGANLAFARYLWPWRGEPGGRWFLVVIGTQVIWCLTYGVALLVYDPTLRLALELLTWVPVAWIGVFFLAFAFEYTGRVDLLRSPAFLVAVGFEIVSTALILTNPLHNLVWEGFELAPAFGVATVTYTAHAWVFVQFVALFAFTTLGVFLLLDTVISYGPLFRKEALAIALTPFPPALAFTAWVFKLGPVPQLNLTPIAFLPHILLDMYALFRRDMFEFNPATRRTAERAAIDDIASAVLIVDEQGRLITLNAAACETFGVQKRAVLADPLGSLFAGDDVTLAAGTQAVSLRADGHRREFNVAITPLTDIAGRQVGYTVVFQDVTTERQRKQRLAVLNRVLRHNLRNDLSVVINYADAIAATGEDDVHEYAEQIKHTSTDLVALGKKARQVATALDSDREQRTVTVAEVLGSVADDLRAEYPEGSITVSGPSALRVNADPHLFELVISSLGENALEHGGGNVEISCASHDDSQGVVVTVSDDGPGIPDHELSPLQSEETSLDHGSGLGLWLVSWGSTALGGEITFECPDDGGTRVELRIPGLVDGPGDEDPSRDRTA